MIACCAFCNVFVAIPNHLVEECFCLITDRKLRAYVSANLVDNKALFEELFYDFFFVFGKSTIELCGIWVSFYCRNYRDGSPIRTNLILESTLDEISFFCGEVLMLILNHLLKEIDHIVKSLCLFSYSGHEYVFFQTHDDMFVFHNLILIFDIYLIT